MNHVKVKVSYYNYNNYCGSGRFDPVRRSEKIVIIVSCKKFKEAVSEDFIGFDNDSYTDTYFTLNIEKLVSYPDDAWHEYMPIEYCPFCGSPINITVEEEFRGLSEKILKFKSRKCTFLKGLNELLLRVLISTEKDKNRKFIYKYGMNKFVWV